MESLRKAKIAVIMPVYNGEKYIKESIQSILNQTFGDFLLVVVDDCSTDGTQEIVKSFNDNRIIYIKNDENVGSVKSRNIALKAADSEYVAILDADDIAEPKRFEIQNAFLDNNPDFGVVTTPAQLIDSSGKKISKISKEIVPPEKIAATLLFHNIFAHSSAMIRRSVMPEKYEPDTVPAEDVDLWLKMIKNTKFITINKPLTKYRVHTEGISKRFSERKREIMKKLLRTQLNKIGIQPSEEELEIHMNNFGYAGSDIIQHLNQRSAWLQRLIIANQTTRVYNDKIFKSVVEEKWLDTCRSNTKIGPLVFIKFISSPLTSYALILNNLNKVCKLLIKSLLFKK
jgi:glycosyltransferase involved in cell wall biosynthesis